MVRFILVALALVMTFPAQAQAKVTCRDNFYDELASLNEQIPQAEKVPPARASNQDNENTIGERTPLQKEGIPHIKPEIKQEKTPQKAIIIH